MPRVKRECIESIKDRVDILDVVSAHVSLKRTGSTYRGLSPFNDEKTPSFYVIPDKQIFKCFSSGHAGDLFRFLELKEGLNFSEAIEAVAHRFNITLEYEEGGKQFSREGQSLKKQLYEIHDRAMEYFHWCFCHDNALSGEIREYWEQKRGFSLEVAKKYKIGFAPPDAWALIKHFEKKGEGFSAEALQKSGLFYLKEGAQNTRGAKSRFRGRLMIPIRDVQGRVVGFAGRQLECTPEDDPAQKAKYINSPETPIFHKSSILFGLESARKSVNDSAGFILAEGQLDVIRLWENGYSQAVAPQGTSITDAQLGMLRRYTPKLTCILDGDAAGQKAALRLLPMAFKASMEANFVSLGEGEDPDEMLKSGRREAFEEYLGRAESPIEFAFKALFPEGVESVTGAEKARKLEKVYGLIGMLESEIAKEEYLAELAKLAKVNRGTLMRDFKNRGGEQVKGGQDEVGEEKAIDSSVKVDYNLLLTSVEAQLLMVVFHYKHVGKQLSSIIDPDWFIGDDLPSKLLRKVLAEISEGMWHGTDNLKDITEGETELNFCWQVMAQSFEPDDLEKTVNQCLRQFFFKYLDMTKASIERKIAALDSQDDALRDLLKERIRIRDMKSTPPAIAI